MQFKFVLNSRKVAKRPTLLYFKSSAARVIGDLKTWEKFIYLTAKKETFLIIKVTKTPPQPFSKWKSTGMS